MFWFDWPNKQENHLFGDCSEQFMLPKNCVCEFQLFMDLTKYYYSLNIGLEVAELMLFENGNGILPDE